MRIKAIINPVAGQNGMRLVTADALELLKKRRVLDENDIVFTNEDGGVPASFFENCDAIMVAGGDGTLHKAINCMKRLGADRPIAYLPTGTMNDFGSSLKLPRNPDRFCKMIENMELKKVDLGVIDDDYFHYVVGGGTLSAVSYSTNQKSKNLFGKSAYYFSAALRFFKILKSSQIRIESAEITGNENAVLYLISNSPVVGGFKNLLPDAQLDDGQLHVLIVRKCSLFAAWKLFRDIKKGRHILNPNVLYFKTRQIKITQLCKERSTMDVDGEKYDNSMPVNLKIIQKGLTIFVPKISQ